MAFAEKPWQRRFWTARRSMVVLLLLICFLCGLLLSVHLNIRRTRAMRNKAYEQHLMAQSGQDFRANPHFEEQYALFENYGAQPCDVLMLGTSYTQRVQWQEAFPGLKILNRGIGSDQLSGIEFRLSQVLMCKPRICFLEAGINDLIYRIPMDTMASRLRKIFSILRDKQIKVVYTHSFYCGEQHEGVDLLNTEIRAWNKTVQLICEEMNIPTIDINEVISENDRRKNEYTLSDGIHLNAAAYQIWFEAIQKHL
ncbi:MAG: GDSL-type esterase/lipase family protein [Chitinophagaceae bacterium]|jgi:lysophospholipase L1-like esterase